jgi:hypothetical protein
MAEGGRRPDEGRGENLNNQVAEILSRSRKVRAQIPNKTKMVAVCKDRRRGKRPTANAWPGRDRILNHEMHEPHERESAAKPVGLTYL